MNRSLKAALLSGLVFPGVGQLFLGHRRRALLFLVTAGFAALYFASAVMEPVMTIAAEIQSGAMPFDPFLIQARLDQTRVDTGAMTVAALVMLVAWAASTLDAWFLGRCAPGVAGR